MPRLLHLLPLLSSLLLPSCLSQADSAARAEYEATQGHGFIQLSDQENTYVEVASHWTGAFGGAAHWEYAVYYCRGGEWWWEPAQRVELCFTDKDARAPTLRRVTADTVEVTLHPNSFGGGEQSSYKVALPGPWPSGLHTRPSHQW